MSRRSIDLSAVALCIAALAAIAFLWNSESRDVEAEAPAPLSAGGVTGDSIKFGDSKSTKTPIETALLTTPWPRIDVTKHMRIHDRASAEKVRADIVKFVWPSGRPLSDPLTKQPDNLFPATELWTLTMKHGIVSRMFFVRARSADSGCLFIFHNGHESPIKSVKSVRTLVDRFTGHGCDVLLISMPLYGVNKDPRFQTDTPHDELRVFETTSFSPFSYFIEPVLRAVDQATRQRSYAHIGMAGFSGGGWTATFAGAIDPRLKNLYSIAGSMPFALDIPPVLIGRRNVSSVRGDYEQSHPFFRTVADYLDLYLLDVFGPDRSAVHFYIEKDQCCFPGAASHAFSGPMTDLARKITGNSLEFVVDTKADRHELAPATLETIFADFTNQKPARTAAH